MTLQSAREAVCALFPVPRPDTLGRQHRSIIHDAIRRGDWDTGKLVRDALAKNDDA